ncbi:MAG TPA: hypothetical protein VFY03_08250, partial [Woeseiaceae bacterium]|nr:hypothetical protein [Woeseiaceae bacterium]
PDKFRLAQGVAFDAWFVSLPREALLERLEDYLDVSAARGYALVDDPFTELEIHAIRGEIEAAREVALHEIFSRSVAAHLGWERAFAQAQFATIVDDPRLQAAMDAWRGEEEEIRRDVAAYLADLQAAS